MWGTSFPDIRYMGVIDRTQTHVDDPNLAELMTLDSFTAGIHFHSLVDLVREKFITSRHAYALVPESPYITQALKLFEDQVLYQKLSNWPEITHYFNEVLAAETGYGVAAADVQKWHSFLQFYLSQSPTMESIRIFVKAIDRPAEMADELIRLVKLMWQSEALLQITHELYDNFEQLIDIKH